METPRSHKRQCQGEHTTLMSLGDDMLSEILHRVPSLPSLARVAFACPRLRKVVQKKVVSSSSSVANRFTTPDTLLGYFISVVGGDIPSFHRALLLSDREVAGIVRRGDFHLADFEDYEWRLMDCRHGLLLLGSDRCLAVFDPVCSSRLVIPHCKNMSNGSGKSWFHCFLPASGDATSFRVLCLESTGGGRVRPHVYSSGEWCSHSLAPKGIKAPLRCDLNCYRYQPMHAGGRIYWRTRAEMLTSLHVGSMEFSHVPFPDNSYLYRSWYALGETEDGTTCIVDIDVDWKLSMRVWFLKEEDGCKWERQQNVDASELDLFAGPVGRSSKVLKVYDITAGVVLLSVGYKNSGARYLAFHLKDILREGTTKTNTKRQHLILADFCTSTGWVHPYFMAWPRPSLKVAGSTQNASTSESEQEAAAGSSKKKQV